MIWTAEMVYCKEEMSAMEVALCANGGCQIFSDQILTTCVFEVRAELISFWQSFEKF